MNTIKTVHEVCLEALQESLNIWATNFAWSVRPIYGRKRGKPEHIGSCILLRIKNIPYLLTAAHVIDENQHTSLSVAGRDGFVKISGNFKITNKVDGDRNRDRYDFAITELSSEMEKKLGEVQYIDENDICMKIYEDNERAYGAWGYPNSKNKKIYNLMVTGKPWGYVGTTCPNSKAKAVLLGVSGEEHIYLLFKDKVTHAATGKIKDLIKPTGMSGGALFDLGRHFNPESIINPPKPRLAGLLIEYRKDLDVMISTRMSTILKSLN